MSFGGFKSGKPDAPSQSSSSSSLTMGGESSGGRSDAFLGRGAAVVGTLSFSGPVEIDCAVEGEIHAQGTLTLGEGANIQGKVYGSEVTVRGVVSGEISASKRLIIKKPARIVGNIASPVVSIEEGVHFEGRCSMVVAVQQQPSSGSESARSKVIATISSSSGSSAS